MVLDSSVGYLSHRTMHMWPGMWCFHRVHLSDEFVDVTTTCRTHPVETVWRFPFAIVPVWLLGIPAQAVMIQRLLQAPNGVIEHGNIRLCLANLLTIYDRLLGTYTPSDRAESVVYGLTTANA